VVPVGSSGVLGHALSSHGPNVVGTSVLTVGASRGVV
jgi:hypothetical protein